MAIPAASDTPSELVSAGPVSLPAVPCDGIIFDSTFIEVPSAPPARVSEKVRQSFLRRWRTSLVVAGIVVFVAVAAAGGSWFFRNHIKADGIMKHRGFGRQLSKDEVPDSRASTLIFRVSKAEKAVENNPASLQATLELMAAYDEVVKSIDLFGRRHAAHMLNNAAWLYATTMHKGARDPARALEMATKAVEITHRRAAGMLDTLAEALLLNGRVAEALDVEKEAVARDPGNPELQKRLEYFQSIESIGHH